MKAKRPVLFSNKNKLTAQAKLQQYRTEWMTALQEDQPQSVKLTAKQKGLYTWLFQNDSEWLKQHMPLRRNRMTLP